MGSASLKHVLIVDDDNINLTCARTVLKGYCKVTPTISGNQALHFLENNTPDLILLDMNMPFMDGFEVMRRIRENPRIKDIPIIFLSANANAVTEAECLEMGAVDFIAKPFVPSVLLNRINRVLAIEDKHHILSDELNERIKEVEDIKDRSQKDVLTGLYNRVYTESLVNKKLSSGAEGVLFMIDMDNFKAINDNYGHIAGDDVLKMMADSLRACAGENDITCRIGGDEFVAFFDGLSDRHEISEKAAALIMDICTKLDEKEFNTNSSISVGIAHAPDDGSEFNKLYNAADKALYYVKQNGKNSYHFYSDSSAEEQGRSGQLVDIGYIEEALNRSDSGTGVYKVAFDSFHHVYNLVSRIVSRSDRDVESVLFTIMPVPGTDPDTTETELAIELLEQAIYSSLRREDISTRYSSRQIFVILMGARDENVQMIVERINAAFFTLYMGGKYTIAYDFVKMRGKKTADRATAEVRVKPEISPAPVTESVAEPVTEPVTEPEVLPVFEEEPVKEETFDPNPFSAINSRTALLHIDGGLLGTPGNNS